MNLISITERYCQSFDWKKLSFFKLCCIAFGVACGLMVPEKYKKTVFFTSLILFLATYVPLMLGFICSAMKEDEEMYL